MTYNGIGLNFYYDAMGRPLSVIYGGATYYYVTNLQGDVVAILDSTGAAVVEYTYDAWGRPLSKVDNTSFGLGDLNPLRYRGYVYDRETGLYYLQSRYYNPTWGRFINADSQINVKSGALGINLFSYCGNNPVNAVDPNGNSAVAICVFIGISTLVGAAIGAFTAACTDGDIVESMIEGAITGAIAATATVFVPQLVAVMLPAATTATVTAVSTALTFGTSAVGGFLVDVATQAVGQVVRNGLNSEIDIQVGRACKTAFMTGIAGVVPTFVNPAESVLHAIGAATVGMDASAINAIIDVVITLFTN